VKQIVAMDQFILDNTKPDDYSNYFEFVLCDTEKKSVNNVDVYNTSFERDKFYVLMYKLMDTNYKYYQKQYKEVLIGDVCYQNFKNEDINIYTVNTNKVDNISPFICAIAQIKNKQSILSLPSSLNIYSENIIRRLIFRVSNRVFVNFENGITDNKKYYKIFINYNHDKDVDVNVGIKHVNDVVSKLTD
jgi:vacuolar-type H+-ATPase subunit F/Vma7